MSARTLPGYSVWQSFTAGRTGTLTEIDMGFFNDMSGEARLDIHSGQGTEGPLLQSLTVPVVARTGSGVMMNAWAVRVSVEAGRQYTFSITPVSLPDPYGVAVGPGGSYEGGVLGLDDPSGSCSTQFDAVFAIMIDSGDGGSALRPVIDGGALPPAISGRPYLRTLLVTGAVGAFTWSLDDGGSGLSLGDADGVLSGTPRTPGTYLLTLSGADSTGTPARPVRRILRVHDPFVATIGRARFGVPAAGGPTDRPLDLLEGATLAVSATAPVGNPAPTLELLDPVGKPLDLGSALRTDGGSARLERFVVPETGGYTLRIDPSSADRTALLGVTLLVKVPRGFSRTLTLADGRATTLVLGALSGSRVKVRIAASREQGVDPTGISARLPGDATATVVPRDAPGTVAFTLEPAASGDVVLTLAAPDGTSGAIRVTVGVRPPRSRGTAPTGSAGGN